MFGYFWELELPLQTEDGIFERSVVLAFPPSPELNVERDKCQPIAMPLLKKKESTLKLGVEGGQESPKQQTN